MLEICKIFPIGGYFSYYCARGSNLVDLSGESYAYFYSEEMCYWFSSFTNGLKGGLISFGIGTEVKLIVKKILNLVLFLFI
jgi:hypothetical protein